MFSNTAANKIISSTNTNSSSIGYVNSSNLYTQQPTWTVGNLGLSNWDSSNLYYTSKSPLELEYEEAFINIFNSLEEDELPKLLDEIVDNLTKSKIVQLLVRKRHFSEDFLLRYYLEHLITESDIRDVHESDLKLKKYSALLLAIEAEKDKEKN